MTDAPPLSAGDLRDELARVYAKSTDRRRRAAFRGVLVSGVDRIQVPIGDEQVGFRVEHARCELSLRRALAASGDHPVVVLVDYDGRVPLDITGRLVGGKVRVVSDDQRLARLFGVRSVSPEVLSSPLGRALLAEQMGSVVPLSGASLDLDMAWRVFLARTFGLPRELVLTEERVVAHATQGGDTSRLRDVLARHGELGDALDRHLTERVGPLAALAVRAALAGRGADVAALGFVLDAVRDEIGAGTYVDAWLAANLPQLDPALKHAVTRQRPLLERWADLAERLWLLELELGESFNTACERADQLISADDTLAAMIAPRPFLQASLSRVKRDLADSLLRASHAGATDGSATRTLVSVFRKLEQHRFKDRLKYQRERVRMAIRLTGWLAGTPEPSCGPTANDAVATLAAAHAAEGGFVDMARTRARGVLADDLDRAIAQVVARADAVRDRLDERFAQALARWERGRGRTLPIEDVLDRVAVPFLAAEPTRKLLVLLMDGMAWNDAAELLEDLEAHHWGPVRWQPDRAQGELLPPVIAALPTITSVSRAALFGGKVPKAGESSPTTADPERFAAHKGLRALLGHDPVLLLKGDAEDRPGHLSEQARRLVASEARAVGLVVNAIDDQLRSGAGVRVPMTLATIKALPDLLTEATQAGRAVLLVADHGHVSGDRFGAARARPGDGGARYRELGAGDAPTDGELVIEGAAGWRSKTGRRLAVLYREVDTFVSARNAGEHGGASLAEVVAPAILIASEDLFVLGGETDDEVDLRRLPRPAWWSLDSDPMAVPVFDQRDALPEVRPTPPTKPPKGVLPGQIAFTAPGLAPTSNAVPSPPSARTGGAALAVASRIRASALYTDATQKDRDEWDTRVIPAVEAVVDAGGSMPRARFADVIGIMIGRLPGVIARIGDKLNLGQHEVFVLDPDQQIVRFDRALFEQLFPEA